MEPLLAFVVDFWWIAPATIGAGGMGYAVITKNSRRARRLELDAARHEETLARRAVLGAKADVRAAQAVVQTAQAHRGQRAPGIPTVSDARRELQRARQALKSATLVVRASRSRVKAVQTRLYAGAGTEPLPIETLMAEHDAVTARWLEYETDAAKVLAFPQMSDARHPATFAFLRAHSEAHRLRPASPKAAVKPEDFVAYRRAVTAAGEALAHAEAEARRAASTSPLERLRQATISPSRPSSAPDPVRRPAPDRGIWPVPSRGSRPSERPEG